MGPALLETSSSNQVTRKRHLRQARRFVCVRNGEAGERHELSSLPGGAVEVSVWEPILDLLQQVPARGAVSNVVAGGAAFIFC
jgi:hypothetical protein